MAVIHQSNLSSWIRCPHAYMLSRRGQDRRQTSAAAYGSVMHHALEAFERLRHTDGVTWAQARDQAQKTFDHYWHPINIDVVCPPVDLWLPRQGFGELRARGIAAIAAYADLMKDDDHELLATEYSFQVPIDGTWDEQLGEPHILAGTIDRLAIRHYSRSPVVCVDDYKTGAEYRYLRQNLQFSAYCGSPDTPVLMADQTWKQLQHLVPGDRILGVDEYPVAGATERPLRHWRESTVEAAWGIVKKAYRLHLSDGRTLLAGSGHRFLAQREGGWDWRTVEDMAEQMHNPRRKQAGIKLAQVYRPARAPIDVNSEDYAAGYIAGATLGDGSLGLTGKLPFWSIVIGAEDQVLLDRLQSYLHGFGITVHPHRREPDGRGWTKSSLRGLRTAARVDVEAIDAICRNAADTDEYAAGWLAGLYDTDGGRSKTSGTICFWQKDQAVLELVAKRAFQFGYTFRIRGRVAELVGDRTERASFTALIQSVLERKHEPLTDRSVRVFQDVRVLRVEDVGEQRLIDITTGTSTYIADGIVSHNCYATTKEEFWTGWRGEDGFGRVRGRELWNRTLTWARRGTWINLRQVKFQDAGWRGPKDYQRFALAVEQVQASIRADIYPLNLSGETCQFCEYRDICAGVGVPDNAHGAPGRR